MRFYNKFGYITLFFLAIGDAILLLSIYVLNFKTGALTPHSLLPAEFGPSITNLFWDNALIVGLSTLLLYQIGSYILYKKQKKIAIKHVNLWRASAICFIIITIIIGFVNNLYWMITLLLLIPIYLIPLPGKTIK